MCVRFGPLNVLTWWYQQNRKEATKERRRQEKERICEHAVVLFAVRILCACVFCALLCETATIHICFYRTQRERENDFLFFVSFVPLFVPSLHSQSRHRHIVPFIYLVVNVFLAFFVAPKKCLIFMTKAKNVCLISIQTQVCWNFVSFICVFLLLLRTDYGILTL